MRREAGREEGSIEELGRRVEEEEAKEWPELSGW